MPKNNDRITRLVVLAAQLDSEAAAWVAEEAARRVVLEVARRSEPTHANNP
jgi:hypothetical protein